MSKNYEMVVEVRGIKKEKFHAVIDFLEEAWFDEVADDIRDEFDNGILNNSDGLTVDFEICQAGFLCGGESDMEFGERLYKGIRTINKAKCKMKLVSMYLEDPPTETFNFGDDEYLEKSE